MIDAITYIGAWTNEPTEVASDGESPVICGSEVDVLAIAVASIKFNTIAAQSLLIGKLDSIAFAKKEQVACFQTSTNVLSICSKGHTHDCD